MSPNTARTVLVDIDDTLADTQEAMLRYVNAKSSQTYRFEEMTRAHREEGIPEYEALVQEFLSQPKLIAECRPIQDALDAMRRLHEAKYEIHIVSSRKERLHSVTEAWLKQHGFADYIHTIHPRSSLYKGKEFKRQIAQKIKPAAGFDDTLEVAEVLAEVGILTYLIHKPWNNTESLPENVHRSESFAMAVGQFLSRVNAPAATSN